MNVKETTELLNFIRANYPNAFSGQTETSAVIQIKSWTAALAGKSYDECLGAFGAYLATDTSGFAPTPGKLNAIIADAHNAELPSPEQTIADYRKAMQNCGYSMRDEATQRAYDSLPEEIKAIVTLADFWNDGLLDSAKSKQFRFDSLTRALKESRKDSNVQLSITTKQKTMMLGYTPDKGD